MLPTSNTSQSGFSDKTSHLNDSSGQSTAVKNLITQFEKAPLNNPNRPALPRSNSYPPPRTLSLSSPPPQTPEPLPQKKPIPPLNLTALEPTQIKKSSSRPKMDLSKNRYSKNVTTFLNETSKKIRSPRKKELPNPPPSQSPLSPGEVREKLKAQLPPGIYVNAKGAISGTYKTLQVYNPKCDEQGVLISSQMMSIEDVFFDFFKGAISKPTQDKNGICVYGDQFFKDAHRMMYTFHHQHSNTPVTLTPNREEDVIENIITFMGKDNKQSTAVIATFITQTLGSLIITRALVASDIPESGVRFYQIARATDKYIEGEEKPGMVHVRRTHGNWEKEKAYNMGGMTITLARLKTGEITISWQWPLHLLGQTDGLRREKIPFYGLQPGQAIKATASLSCTISLEEKGLTPFLDYVHQNPKLNFTEIFTKEAPMKVDFSPVTVQFEGGVDLPENKSQGVTWQTPQSTHMRSSRSSKFTPRSKKT